MLDACERIESTARGKNIVLDIVPRNQVSMARCLPTIESDTGSDACEYSHAGVVYLNRELSTVLSR